MLKSSKAILAAGLAGLVLVGTVAEASAARARQQYANGHGYGYGYRYHRHYGNPAVGAAIAGTALGIAGLAAGAAVGSRYYDDGYYGPGNGYYAPGYYDYGYGY